MGPDGCGDAVAVSATVAVMTPRTLGVEEELVVVDPTTREAAPSSHLVTGDGVDHELFRHQVEVQTEPATDLGSLRDQVVHGRRVAGVSAQEHGLVVMASGTAPLGTAQVEVSDDDRYRAMVDTFGETARAAGTCGLHVHVGITSAEEGVAVIDRIGAWLPLVLALSANSPFVDGRDSGYASWRSQLWDRWPTAGPTAPFGSVEEYDAVARRLVATGAARDRGMLYYDARLAEAFSTVEVRVADVPTEVDVTVLLAAVVRGLVVRAVADADAGTEAPRPRVEILRAARWLAARDGVAGSLLHPTSGDPCPARDALTALVEHAGEALEAHGDLTTVRAGIEQVLAGGGASRQRAAHERSGHLEGVVDDLVARTGAV